MVMKEKGVHLFGAPVAMREKGAATDAVVLEEIMKKPGITVSEIAETLGWSNGKVDGSVNRLRAEGKASVKHYLQRGMLVKRVYPEKYSVKPRNIMEVPVKLVNGDLWKDNAVVYALSRSTMGVAPEQVEEWDKKAFFKEGANIKKGKATITVTLPERFCDFYQLENSDMSLSVVGNFVLATVESVLPVRLPAAYPEEGKQPVARYRITLERERMEGVSSNLHFVYLREGKTKELTFFSGSPYAVVNKEPEKILTAVSSEPCKELIKVPVEVE